MFNWFRKTPEDVRQFIKLLKRSRLLAEHEVDRRYKQFRGATTSTSESAKGFVEYLVDQAALTRWQ